MRPTISRILAPVDFSGHSDQAVDYAAMLAAALGASLRLIHVAQVPIAPHAWSGEFYGFALPELETGLVAEAEHRMGQSLNRLTGTTVPITTEVLVGHPAMTIVEVAARESIDLIVMGSHGRTGVAHLVMGSVAERVTRTAPCPVLTVRDAFPAAQKAPALKTVIAV